MGIIVQLWVVLLLGELGGMLQGALILAILCLFGVADPRRS